MSTPDGEGTIGVLGGMGPEATVEFMRRVIAATPAADDADHIRMIVDCNPKVPSRIKALLEGGREDPTPVLAAMARGLERAGAQVLVIPCNTAHHYLPAIRAAVAIPVIDGIGRAAEALALRTPAPRQIGVLASPALKRVGLLEPPFLAHGLSLHYPSDPDQSKLLEIIRAVKAGRKGSRWHAAYRGISRRLVQAGAEALLVACTELSVFPRPELGVPVIDTLDVLVDATVAAGRSCSADRPA